MALRLVFYYPWFPRNWTQLGSFPYANYHPTQGYYDSADTNVIKTHIRSIEYGGFDGVISSWWGIKSDEDQNFQRLLETTVSQSSPLKWCIYYEHEGDPTPPNADQIAGDLAYIQKQYADHPSYMKIDDRFVVFVYGSHTTGLDTVKKWIEASKKTKPYLVLKVFSNYRSCPQQPDAWHEYAPANPLIDQSPDGVTISPGFWKYGEQPRLTRDLAAWQRNVRLLAKRSKLKFHLVTTFNEHGEGTPIESCKEWQTPSLQGSYLDVLHNTRLIT
jgi:hypothetical protein